MIFTENLEYPEAPILLKDGSWLVTEMSVGNGRLTKVSACGKHHWPWVETGRPNGLLQDKEGFTWVAESLPPSLLKISPEGKKITVLESGDSLPFMWPNDLVFGPDGAIYMTDSGIKVSRLVGKDGLGESAWNEPMEGRLFRIDPVSHRVECLDQGYRFANGLAFGPDGKLYVNEMVTGHVYRYDFDDKLLPHTKELFASVIDPTGPARIVGPDGMAFDQAGNFYICLFGQGHVAVVAPDGQINRSIVTRGSCPTNIAFGPKGSHLIYVTELQRGRIETFTVEHDGYAPPGPLTRLP